MMQNVFATCSRGMRPTHAARYGGLAALVHFRLGRQGLRLPTLEPAICVCNLRIPGAAMLPAHDRGEKIVIRLEHEAHFEPDVEFVNVVGGTPRTQKPPSSS